MPSLGASMKWTRNPIQYPGSLRRFDPRAGRTSLMAQSGVFQHSFRHRGQMLRERPCLEQPFTATYISTRAQRSTTTGADGTFLFLQLSAGNYRVAAQASRPLPLRRRDCDIFGSADSIELQAGDGGSADAGDRERPRTRS